MLKHAAGGSPSLQTKRIDMGIRHLQGLYEEVLHFTEWPRSNPTCHLRKAGL